MYTTNKNDEGAVGGADATEAVKVEQLMSGLTKLLHSFFEKRKKTEIIFQKAIEIFYQTTELDPKQRLPRITESERINKSPIYCILCVFFGEGTSRSNLAKNGLKLGVIHGV